MHTLSRTDARRIAVRAQLLDKARPTGLLDVVRELTLLQIDPTAAVAPSADLVLWSRLGASYSPQQLTSALETRNLIELRGMIRPAQDIALYRADMALWPGTGAVSGWKKAQAKWVEANDVCRRDIIATLTRSGPAAMRDLPDRCVVPWKSSGWNNNRNVSMMLEMMVLRGEVAVAGRERRERLWDIAARVYPDGPAVPEQDALRGRNERRLRALGIARSKGPECPVEPSDVGDVGEPAVIDGLRGNWRVDPAQLGRPFAGRAALLSPFDRLIHDRRRMVELFDFDYQLEMFKPFAKRRFGYFALPILYGDRFIGRLDAAADRDKGLLVVNAVHDEVPFSAAMRNAVHGEIENLALWLGLRLRMPV